MTEYIANGVVLQEITTPTTPPTSIVKLYAKTDGIYYLDDTGTYIRLATESDISGREATSHIWTPEEFYLSANATLATFNNVMVTPTARLHTSIISNANTPWWPSTQEFIDALDGGDEIFLRFGVESGVTGDVELELTMGQWDESDNSFVTETRNQTITITTAGKMQVIEQEFSALAFAHVPSSDDWFQFKVKRIADDVADTMAAELHILWVKILPKTGAAS